MMDSLKITTSKTGNVITYVLAGAMDEHAQYPKISGPDIESVVFDFAGVELINSTGLQSWIKFLESVPTAANVIFRRCSQRVINQLNLFPGFTANRVIRVDSFFAPYHCASCDSSKGVLLELKEHTSEVIRDIAPEIKCDKCARLMEFDSIPKKYFLFAKSLA